MTAVLKSGAPVRVHIGGKEFDPDGFDGEFVDRSEFNVDVELHGETVTFPANWVERVPQRWREPVAPDTYVKVHKGDDIRIYMRLHSREETHWYDPFDLSGPQPGVSRFLTWPEVIHGADEVLLATFSSLAISPFGAQS